MGTPAGIIIDNRVTCTTYDYLGGLEIPSVFVLHFYLGAAFFYTHTTPT